MSLFAEDFEKIEGEIQAGLAQWRQGIANTNRKEAEAGHKKVKQGVERLESFANVHLNFLKELGQHLLRVDEFVLQELRIMDRHMLTSLLSNVDTGLSSIRASASNLLQQDLNMPTKDAVLRSDMWKRAFGPYDQQIKPVIAELSQLSGNDVELLKGAVSHARTKPSSPAMGKAVGDLVKLEKELGKIELK